MIMEVTGCSMLSTWALLFLQLRHEADKIHRDAAKPDLSKFPFGRCQSHVLLAFQSSMVTAA